MLRTTVTLCGALSFVMAFGTSAGAADPVKDVTATVERVAGGDTVPAIGVEVPPRPTTVRSAVVGYIRIVKTIDVSSRLPSTTWTASGALADPTQWTCSGSGGTSSYTVSCTPNVLPVNVAYTCQVLHADIFAPGLGSSGRTSMDCDSDGVPEAQTGQKFGPGGYDFVWAVSTASVTHFTCTLDLALPNVTAGCGDPGTVGVE